MISNRPMIPMLTHVDNLGDLNLDMTSQEQSLETIASNTQDANESLFALNQKMLRFEDVVNDIGTDTNSIRTSSSNATTQLGTIKTDTAALTSSVGTTADESSANTVIGLLKSIVNKLS